MAIGLAACAGEALTGTAPARNPRPDLEAGFIVDATEDEIRSVIEGHQDGLDADLVVELYRAPLQCWKFYDLCWDVSEVGAMDVLRGEWNLISAGVSGEELRAAVVALIDEVDDTHPPGIHPTRDEEVQFVTQQAHFAGFAPSNFDEWVSDYGKDAPQRPISITGENVGDGSGSFNNLSDARNWCFDGGGNDDVTSTYGTLNVKASSPYVVIGTQARVKATSTTARDLEIDGEFVVMTVGPTEAASHVRTESQYTEAFEANALSIVLNSPIGANYKGSGGCATADSSAEWCACRNPWGWPN